MIGNFAEPNRKRLFFAANLAMFMIGLGFAVRANIAVSLQRELFDRLDLANPINGRSRERRVAELFKCKTLRAAD